MASFAYNELKRALLEAEIDFPNDDIRVMLVMTNTTADTEDDVNTISGFTTLDECDDTGYSRQALTSEAVNEDSANDRAEFDAADVTFSNNGDASRNIDGAIVFKHVTNDTDSVPIAFIDFTETLNGNDLIITWNTEGIIQLG